MVGDGQEASKGNAINFWNDAFTVTTSLPRPLERCGIVHVKPKNDSSGCAFEVRPNLLRAALVWLRRNNPLCRKVNISESVLADLEAFERSTERPSIVDDELQPLPPGSDCRIGGVDAVDESYMMATGDTSTITESDRIRQTLCVDIDGLDEPINEYTAKTTMQSCFPILFPNGYGGLHPIDGEARMFSYDLAEYYAHAMAWHDRRFVMDRTYKFFLPECYSKTTNRWPDTED